MMNIDHNLQTHFISIQAGCTPYMTGVWKYALNIMVDANTPPERFHVANKKCELCKFDYIASQVTFQQLFVGEVSIT